jgi:hypothetical protein
MKNEIVQFDAHFGDWGHESEETERDYEQQIRDCVETYSGYATQVHSGWVWVVGSNEQRWSRRSTRHACERVVYQVVELLGEEDAFDLYTDDEFDDAASFCGEDKT